MLEIIVTGDIFWCNYEGINIGARTIDTEPKTAVGKNLASSISDEDFVVGFLFLGDTANELIADELQRFEDFVSKATLSNEGRQSKRDDLAYLLSVSDGLSNVF